MRKTFGLLLLTALICHVNSGLFGAPRGILLHVESVDFAWAESRLAERLRCQLSRDPDMRIAASVDRDAVVPDFPSTSHDIDSLFNWGREVGGRCRYFMLVTVQSERLEKRKTFSIPLILHQYETVGVIEGEWRFLDLKRGRLLAAEPFAEKIRARRIIQGDPDNSVDDPGLHIPAPAKMILFGELEQKLAERLARRARVLTRSR